ncbi:MAG TPA: hypothetical protein PKI08_08255, partial [Aquaticitalea sp.]|nr:hypothetical protein [Aquaticitalea sp.]
MFNPKAGYFVTEDFAVGLELGIGSYNDHIEEYLHSKSGSSTNRIMEEISIHDLLKYNAIDSYVEYHVAEIQ